jgi:hypothetical protein
MPVEAETDSPSNQGGIMAIAAGHDVVAELRAALGAHREWKSRLQAAISSGRSDFNPSVVAHDTNCDFGKWIHNGASAEAKASRHYDIVRRKHASFHAEAGRVLALAIGGKTQEAREALGADSDFANYSAALTKEITAWSNEIG